MEDILAGFDAATAADWKSRLEKDLKGITFEQLSVVDDNGITINPFYTNEQEAQKPAVFSHTDWSILEKVIVADERTANAQALAALSTGASGLIFECTKEHTDWGILLQGVELNYIYTFFNVKGSNAAAIAALLAYTSRIATVTIGQDYLAAYACSADKQVLAPFEQGLAEIMQTGQIVVEGSLYYNAGAHSTYQLGLITAQVNEYLQALSDQNGLGTIKQVHITIATGTAFFEEIAKLRALKQLIGLLVAQYEISPELFIQVQTGTLYKAPFDAYNNLLRDTLAGMAAVMGGCNALYVLPFDEGFSKGKEAFSRRMSINEQLLLKEESYLHHIADVANGSYYLETLTAQLGEKAWAYFKEIEAAGGFIAAFEQGIITKAVKEQAALLIGKYQSGERIWIGMNKYPNSVDMPQKVEKAAENEQIIAPLNLAAYIIA